MTTQTKIMIILPLILLLVAATAVPTLAYAHHDGKDSVMYDGHVYHGSTEQGQDIKFRDIWDKSLYKEVYPELWDVVDKNLKFKVDIHTKTGDYNAVSAPSKFNTYDMGTSLKATDYHITTKELFTLMRDDMIEGLKIGTDLLFLEGALLLKGYPDLGPVSKEHLKKLTDGFSTLGDPVNTPLTPDCNTGTYTREGPEHITRHIIYPLYGTTMHEQKLKRIPNECSAFVVIDGDILWEAGKNPRVSYDIMKTYDANKDGWLTPNDPIWDKIKLLDHYGNFLDPDNLEIPIVALSYEYQMLPDDDTPAPGSYVDELPGNETLEHFRAFAVSHSGVVFADGSSRATYATPQQAITDCSTYDALYFLAEGTMLQGNSKEAIDRYIEIAKRCPGASHPIAGIGSVFHNAGNPGAAAFFYSIALDGDSENFYYWSDVAVAEYSLGYKQEAWETILYSHSLNSEHNFTNIKMAHWGLSDDV